MRIGIEFAQVVAVFFDAALFLPETGDARAVLPTIEARQVFFDFDGAQRNPRAQTRIETPIDFSARFHRSQRMTLALADDHLLRIAAGQRGAKPRLWQLPEQRAFAAIFAGHFGAHQQTTEQGFGRRLIQLPSQLLASGSRANSQ
jgi:hypothetical protein